MRRTSPEWKSTWMAGSGKFDRDGGLVRSRSGAGAVARPRGLEQDSCSSRPSRNSPSAHFAQGDRAANLSSVRQSLQVIWHFYFKINGDSYYLLDIMPHPK